MRQLTSGIKIKSSTTGNCLFFLFFSWSHWLNQSIVQNSENILCVMTGCLNKWLHRAETLDNDAQVCWGLVLLTHWCSCQIIKQAEHLCSLLLSSGLNEKSFWSTEFKSLPWDQTLDVMLCSTPSIRLSVGRGWRCWMYCPYVNLLWTNSCADFYYLSECWFVLSHLINLLKHCKLSFLKKTRTVSHAVAECTCLFKGKTVNCQLLINCICHFTTRVGVPVSVAALVL